MFSGCSSLESLPTLVTTNGTDFSGMFSNCYSLSLIPALNFSSGTTFLNTFLNMYSLQRCQVTGIAENVSFVGANLSGTALNEIYTNLATVTSKTITVTGVWGAATDTISIATNKGWTVSG
jgi:hypothetical protein